MMKRWPEAEATKGMSDEQAAEHIRQQELEKTLPPELKKNWGKMSKEQREKALKHHEDKLVVERAIAPVKNAIEEVFGDDARPNRDRTKR